MVSSSSQDPSFVCIKARSGISFWKRSTATRWRRKGELIRYLNGQKLLYSFHIYHRPRTHQRKSLGTPEEAFPCNFLGGWLWLGLSSCRGHQLSVFAAAWLVEWSGQYRGIRFQVPPSSSSRGELNVNGSDKKRTLKKYEVLWLPSLTAQNGDRGLLVVTTAVQYLLLWWLFCVC